MIPSLGENGYLPPGIHQATFDEIAATFGQGSELRRVQLESLRWLLELAMKAGVGRVVINGSFVTDAVEPNDVDCVLLVAPDFPLDPNAERELLSGLPFLDINLVEQHDFDLLVGTVFATDRASTPKGVVEVIL